MVRRGARRRTRVYKPIGIVTILTLRHTIGRGARLNAGRK